MSTPPVRLEAPGSSEDVGEDPGEEVAPIATPPSPKAGGWRRSRDVAAANKEAWAPPWGMLNGLPVPEPAVVVAPGGVLGVMVEGEATAAAAAMEAVVVCVQGMGRVVPPPA